MAYKQKQLPTPALVWQCDVQWNYKTYKIVNSNSDNQNKHFLNLIERFFKLILTILQSYQEIKEVFTIKVLIFWILPRRIFYGFCCLTIFITSCIFSKCPQYKVVLIPFKVTSNLETHTTCRDCSSIAKNFEIK